jgi:hypothetical protein
MSNSILSPDATYLELNIRSGLVGLDPIFCLFQNLCVEKQNESGDSVIGISNGRGIRNIIEGPEIFIG